MPGVVISTGGRSTTGAGSELADAIARLRREFPGVPRDAVVSVLGDSLLAVVEAAGAPVADKAEELARLRLEIRTGRPALTDDPATDSNA